MASHLTRDFQALDRIILTPPPGPSPRINGARIFGARPGSPVLYQIAATGERPMQFSAAGLPAGLTLDDVSGLITGSVPVRGTYAITLQAANSCGQASRDLRLVIGDEIALTPPMGCNSYGGWGPFVSEKTIRAAAAALVQTGLVQHGFCYVNIDDGWQGKRGGSYAAIQPNEKFGDPGVLCADLHQQGLKVGFYSSPWTSTYEGFVGGSSDSPDGAWTRPDPPRSGIGCHGRYTFEENDARQLAEWGFDYFKYDWGIRQDPDGPVRARRMGDALRRCGRDVVFELSNSAAIALAAEYTAIGTMCRTTNDLVDIWDRSQLEPHLRETGLIGIRELWEENRTWQPYNRPGHWNMPCPLRVGELGGWDLKPLRPSRLTPDEQYAHISLWCLWSAPLIIGCPPERLDAFTLSLLSNDEVLELDQDPLGRQALQIDVPGGAVLYKLLEDGSLAVGLFNLENEPASVTADFAEIGLAGKQRVRDLWRQMDIGTASGCLTVAVAPHGVGLYRIWPVG
jgi:alpha-galactosidase